MKPRPTTLGALISAHGDQRPHTSVKEELRNNLIAQLKGRKKLFPGVHGYESTVIPHIINAILSQHSFILLGVRGQAKSRILRSLTTLLDHEIPVIAGSETNDNPFAPISRYGKELIETAGDDTPVDWLAPEQRYVEKLATPDVTVADLIGDMDPIKAARGGHLLSDELTIHYGMLPRANRGIFALNELPDLAGKVQVGLFNVMQEGDVQIKGYPVRLPLDVMIAFSANPEDYTARGKIITPLKDRIGSEIHTHYPESVETGVAITAQEAYVDRGDTLTIVHEIIAATVERVAVEAREDKRIDQRSGVSQRLPITLLENVVSNAERRSVLLNEAEVAPRIVDIYAALPAITGKIELEYEGELVGSAKIARELIQRASAATLSDYFMRSRQEESDLVAPDMSSIVDWFNSGSALQLSDQLSVSDIGKVFETIPGLIDAAGEAGLPVNDELSTVISCEIVLESLVAQRRISHTESGTYMRSTRRQGGFPTEYPERDE